MTSTVPSAAVRPPSSSRSSAARPSLPRDGSAKCDQVTAITTAQIGPRIGRINPEAMEQIDAALRFVFAL